MSCPACSSAAEPAPVERWHDAVGGNDYVLSRCVDCGVVFSEPREAVSADWYEKAAPLRAKEARKPPEDDRRFRSLFSEGLTPGKVLDVGCGDGGFLLLARRRGFATTGFDYDRRVVAQAEARGLEDVHAAEFSTFCASRRDGEFDLITLFDVLEHTPEPSWFLRQLARLLKPGGHMAITLPNADRPVPWGREEHDFPPHHFTRWSPEAMKGFLERHGFVVEHQDAGHLRVAYLADHFFFLVLMPGLLAAARRFLFGRERGTISSLYAESGTAAPAGGLKGALADKLLRQKLVNAFKAACSIFTYPLAAALVAYYRLTRPLCGDCLYTLARKS